MAPHRPDPALLRTDHGDRLLLDHRLFEVEVDLGRRGELGPPLAQLRLLAELFLGLLDLAGDRLPLRVVRFEQLLEARLLLLERIMLAADLHLLELAQGPQAHIEDGFGLQFGELEARISTGFGSSSVRMMRITSSRLR